MNIQSEKASQGITTVSVVIPCYNATLFVAAAIASVKSQTALPSEIIVVDDGSTDGSAEVAASIPGVTVVRIANSGPSAARNAGVQAASADVIVFLDADDLLHPNCIASRLELLETSPMVVGAYRLVNTDGELISEDRNLYRSSTITVADALERMACPTVGLTIRRKAFLEIAGFDESLRIGEDSDLLLRMCKVAPCASDPEPRGDYRVVEGSLSRDYTLWFDSYRRVFAKAASAHIGTPLERRVSFTNLVCDRVFGKLLKDRQERFLPAVTRLIAKRPALAFYFSCWIARAFGNRLLWLIGRGPLRSSQATSPGSS